jgi:DNA-directed RNA polymerase specialized sigma24 family protein
MISGSIEWENNHRLQTLYNKHNDWLNAVAFKLTRDYDEACDLVGDLYIYLAEKCNPKLFYLDSFNLQYLRSYISSRFINQRKRGNKQLNTSYFDSYDKPELEYDVEADQKFETAYWEVMTELNEMKATPKWVSGKLFEIYHFSDMTIDGVAKDVGISKATCFLHVKKTKGILKSKIKNPFDNE